MTTATKKAPKKPAKKAAVLDAPKDLKKTKPTAAGEHETLVEAKRIAATIRGLRHEEEGLSGELKEVRARITTLTDEQSRVLLDDAAGQQRLPFSGADKPAKNGKRQEPPSRAEQPGGLETDVDGWRLRITTDPDGYVATKEKDGKAEQVGVFTVVQNAQNELLDGIGWHGSQPDWRPVPLTDAKG